MMNAPGFASTAIWQYAITLSHCWASNAGWHWRL